MRPEVNLNQFEISFHDKIPLRCEVTSLSALVHETRRELKPV